MSQGENFSPDIGISTSTIAAGTTGSLVTTGSRDLGFNVASKRLNVCFSLPIIVKTISNICLSTFTRLLQHFQCRCEPSWLTLVLRDPKRLAERFQRINYRRTRAATAAKRLCWSQYRHSHSCGILYASAVQPNLKKNIFKSNPTIKGHKQS